MCLRRAAGEISAAAQEKIASSTAEDKGPGAGDRGNIVYR